MPLPAVLGSVIRGAVRSAPAVLSSIRRVRVPSSGGGASAFFGTRRRRRSGLTATEMGKITFMAQTLGKRNPAVTLIVMKALGGRL